MITPKKELSPIGKSLIFILIFLVTILLLGYCLTKSKAFDDEECKCYKYKEYTKTKLYPSGYIEIEKDSICTVFSVGGTITSLNIK